MTWRLVVAGLTVPAVLFAVLQVLDREEPAAAAQFCGAVPAPVAHRGGTERAAENTLDAFKAAGDAGVTYWELDVHFDKNGTAVVLHDPRSIGRARCAEPSGAWTPPTGASPPTTVSMYPPCARSTSSPVNIARTC
jgi:glycerophosphoryl diester phosphodiesterase